MTEHTLSLTTPRLLAHSGMCYKLSLANRENPKCKTDLKALPQPST